MCERIIEAVTGHQDFGHERQVISLSQDSFYRELTGSESKKAEKGLFNFDHPGTTRINVSRISDNKGEHYHNI